MPPVLAEPRLDTGIDRMPPSGQGARLDAPQSPLKDEHMTSTLPVLLDDLETPAVVRDLVSRIRDLPPGEEKAYEREFKLSYYYGGRQVALAADGRGPLVLAAGTAAEVVSALGSLPKEKKRGRVKMVAVDTFRSIQAGFARAPRGDGRADR